MSSNEENLPRGDLHPKKLIFERLLASRPVDFENNHVWNSLTLKARQTELLKKRLSRWIIDRA